MVRQLKTGSIREVLSEEISEETEDLFVGILKNHMAVCARILVKVIWALELGFRRTRTLMDNQGECDHVFYVRD